jgi:hypothetical protein
MDRVSVPIACQLDRTDARRQFGEWQRLMERPTVTVRRASATELELGLAEGPEGLADVVDLARREKACCPFFDFTLRIGADTVTLVLSVPDEAIAVLDGFDPTQG